MIGIREYVETTRRLIGAPFPQMEEIYRHNYERIRGVLNWPGSFPELFISYSTNRTCEIVRLGDQHYLIYDQYLGSSLNFLNRVYLGSSRRDAIRFGYRILAEQLQLQNELKLALICAVAYSIWRPDSEIPAREPSFELRCRMTHVQEIYVVVHELFHFSLAGPGKNEVLAPFREMVRSYYREWLSDTVTPAEYEAEYRRKGLDRILSEEAIAADVKDAPAILGSLVEFLDSRDELVEEVACDLAAAFYTISIARAEGVPFRTCLLAILVGLHSLRCLSVLHDWSAARLKFDDAAAAQSTTEGAIRLMLTRKLMSQQLRSDGRTRIADWMHSDKVNARFQELILTPILYMLPQMVREVLEKADSVPTYPDAEANEMIDGLTAGPF